MPAWPDFDEVFLTGDNWLIFFPPVAEKRVKVFSGIPFIWAFIPFMRVPGHDLMNFQRLHLMLYNTNDQGEVLQLFCSYNELNVQKEATAEAQWNKTRRKITVSIFFWWTWDLCSMVYNLSSLNSLLTNLTTNIGKKDVTQNFLN